MSESLGIHFHGPYGLAGQHERMLFGESISQEAGVYLWTVRTSDGFLVEYVGQTGESFAKRTKDHMIHTFGGNYRVCDPQLMRQGQLKVVWLGLWRRGTKDKMPEFAQRYLSLAPAIQEYLDDIEAWMEHIMPSNPPIEIIDAGFQAWTKERSVRQGLTEKSINAFEAANPSWMTPAGLQRYWRKNRQPV